MTLPRFKQAEHELRRLDRHNSWMWGLAVLVMAALGVAVSTVYLAPVPDVAKDPFPAPETRGLLAGGLCGIVALFCLYILLKQFEMQRLRLQVFEARLGEESLRSRLSGLSSLLEGITQVASHLDLDAVLEALSEHVRITLKSDQVSIMLIDPEHAQLACRAVSGVDTEFVRGARVELGQGISGWVAEHNQALVLDHDALAARFPTQEKPGRNISSAVCVPLAVRDHVIGVLNINRIGSGSPFAQEDAQLLTVFAAHAAIAIRRIIEKRQDESVRQVQKMEALGRLAGGVAHDFNNMLTVILTYATRLENELGSRPHLRAAVQKILTASERCASLTRQLLAFGRKQIVEPETLELNSSVISMTELLRRVIREDIEMVATLAPEAGYVHADPGQIEQVILNLVLNARDAMPHGGHLTIETTSMDVNPGEVIEQGVIPPGSYVVLRVGDTGLGMDAETLRNIFEPFFTTKGRGGTGLGLATAHGIVKQCGGHIAVRSQPGEGSLFQIYLPRVPKRAAPPPSPGSQSAQTDEPRTILLVEDEEVVREVTREFLEMGGYKVHSACHGREAIQMSERCEETIDLLLTDVIMPGLSGREVAERLRSTRPEMPVLYMSGYTGDVLDLHGVSNEHTAFLQKPFASDALLAKVREVASRSLP